MNTLKQYKGPKSVETIQTQSDALSLVLECGLYEQGRSDFVVLKWPGAPEAAVYFNTVNGRFFGTTDQGAHFASGDPRDAEPWFVELLDFFLEPLEPQQVGSDKPLPLNLGEAVFEWEAVA